MKDNLLPKSILYFFRVSFRLFTMAGKLKDEAHAVSTLNFPARVPYSHKQNIAPITIKR